ncbi:hypothetical protein XBO1_2440008 [Xenorhabdus bovienii str. oregonense]|uniref:Uncharacterized protein n=1 Tax=Xenorhabdus bovienii str. oregonense TaxID=1398202 RepID=A0A077P6N3_XENBV|nr:hypothetical protein XBO1_2440008 [Xenorhabdus bovienii str. oregonense]
MATSSIPASHVCAQRNDLNPTFIEGYNGGSAVLAYCFTEKTQGGCRITVSGQQKVNRLTVS